MKQDKKIWILLSVFLLLGAMNICHHELWRDELQAWLIAGNSADISELFKNLEYEGHPALWHLLLFLITRFGAAPFTMQIIHLFLAVGAVFVFLKYSPFSNFHKSLFIFGYFPIYEYAVISRNYVLGMLFIFLICAQFRHVPKKLITVSILLFLLCQTNIYGWIIALCLAPVMAIFTFFQETDKVSIKKSKIIFSLLITGSGIFLGIMQMIPPPNSGFASRWIFEFKPELLYKVFSTFYKSMLPFPSIRVSFWNSNVLDFLGNEIQALLSIFLILIVVGIFLRKSLALGLFLAGILGIFLFSYIKYFGYLRHFGNLYILFVAAWWISFYMKEKEFSPALKVITGISNFFSLHKNKFLTIILSLQLGAGLIAVYFDFVHPFSNGEKAAAFLKKNEPESILVETSDYFTSITVAGHMNKKKVYHPQCDRFGSFVVWDKCSGEGLDFPTAFKKGEKLSRDQKQDAILITIQEQDTAIFNMERIAEFSDSAIVADERYFIYKIRY